MSVLDDPQVQRIIDILAIEWSGGTIVYVMSKWMSERLRWSVLRFVDAGQGCHGIVATC